MFTLEINSEPNTDNVKEAIEYNEKLSSRYNKMQKYYSGEHIIKSRSKNNGLKNNQIVVNHAKFITDINVGYLLGNQVEYQYDDEKKDKDNNTSLLDDITREYRRQTISDLDHELAKTVSKFGIAYELVYANQANEVKSSLIDPRNCIIVYDNTVEHNKLFAVTYKEVINKEEFVDVKVYTNKEIIECDDKLVQGESVEHKFQAIPVLEYRNNPEKEGDYFQVISLIDAYNIDLIKAIPFTSFINSIKFIDNIPNRKANYFIPLSFKVFEVGGIYKFYEVNNIII